MSKEIALPQSELDVLLSSWRAKIISDVCREGLKPGKTLKLEGQNYLGCNDPETPEVVYGSILRRNPKRLSRDLENVLYQHYSSVFPVLMERPSSEPYHITPVLDATQFTVNQRIFTERVSALFLVVIPYCSQGKYEDTHSDIYSEYDMILVRMFDKVLPDSFAYLVFPQTIWEKYGPPVNDLSTRRVPVKIVGFIKRKIFGIADYLVPNYEQALMEIFRETQGELWVHGVKLPTIEDVIQLRD